NPNLITPLYDLTTLAKQVNRPAVPIPPSGGDPQVRSSVTTARLVTAVLTVAANAPAALAATTGDARVRGPGAMAVGRVPVAAERARSQAALVAQADDGIPKPEAMKWGQ